MHKSESVNLSTDILALLCFGGKTERIHLQAEYHKSFTKVKSINFALGVKVRGYVYWIWVEN